MSELSGILIWDKLLSTVMLQTTLNQATGIPLSIVNIKLILSQFLRQQAKKNSYTIWGPPLQVWWDTGYQPSSVHVRQGAVLRASAPHGKGNLDTDLEKFISQ